MLRGPDVKQSSSIAAGLAASSSRKEVDPWLGTEVHGGRLCARLMGGTREYFCDQQLELLREVEAIEERGEDARRAFDEWRTLTPATSDLYQVGMTMLEAHARALPLVGLPAFTPRDAAARCAARTREEDLAALSPEQTEDWLAEKKIEPPLELGALVAKRVGGARLLELAARATATAKDLMVALELKNLSRAKKLQNAIRRNVSSRADAVAHAKVADVLCKCLAPAVGDRFATALDVLEALGATADFDHANQMAVLGDITQAVGGDLLPPSAVSARVPDRHADAIVNATLGGLTKRLLRYDDVQGALTTCTEWIGVASPDARADAVSVFCKLWKECGGELRALELSRATHSHWCKDMLGGEGVMRRIAASLSPSAAAGLERVDLSEQCELEAGVLEVLLGACALPRLRVIKLAHCQSATGDCGSIPATIGQCEALEMLDLTNSNFTGCVWSSFSSGFVRSHFVDMCIAIARKLPNELGKLLRMTTVALQYNDLSGELTLRPMGMPTAG